jgi:DNA invertase Pin-like site-specific DNA recombinase
MNVYGYTRVSTGRQVEEGESLDVQKRVISGYCQMKGYDDPVFVREEGVSGSKPLMQRPAGGKLISQIGAGDIIIAAKLDRMFRSSVDALAMLEEISKRGAHLHLIDLGGDINNDMVGKLVFTILSAVAEAERMRIQERIRDVKKDQKDRGRYLGGPEPFGWKRDSGGTLQPFEEEQKAIARIMQLREDGKSLRQIDKTLKQEGIRSSYATVRRVTQGEAGEMA